MNKQTKRFSKPNVPVQGQTIDIINIINVVVVSLFLGLNSYQYLL